MPDEASAFDRWVDFLWATWSALGVSSWHRGAPPAVVDPEALVVVTEVTGDLRLQRETIDWGIAHAHLLAPTRLRNLAARAGAGEAVETWIATVAAHTRRARWRADSRLAFADFQPSGRSKYYAEAGSNGAATLALRHRAVVGAGARGEVIRALHRAALGTGGPRSTSEIAAAAGSTSAQVGPILDELVSASVVTRSGSVRRRRHAPRLDPGLASATWQPWRDVPAAPWVEAVDIAPVLIKLVRLGRAGSDPARVAAAMNALHTIDDPLETALGERAAEATPGDSASVARELADTGQRLLDSLRRRLWSGVGPAGSASEPRLRADPWTQVTWIRGS